MTYLTREFSIWTLTKGERLSGFRFRLSCALLDSGPDPLVTYGLSADGICTLSLEFHYGRLPPLPCKLFAVAMAAGNALIFGEQEHLKNPRDFGAEDGISSSPESFDNFTGAPCPIRRFDEKGTKLECVLRTGHPGPHEWTSF